MTLHLNSKKPIQPNDLRIIDSNYSNSIPLSQKSTIKFNDSVGKKAGLPNLKDNEIITHESATSQVTNVALKDKIQTLISDLKDDINKLENLRRDIEQTKNNDISYYVNKSLFQKSQQAESLRQQIEWKQNLKNDLQEVLDDIGFDGPDTKIPTGLSDKLEDLPYFHGIIPRTHTVNLLINKGDYLLRKNDRGKIVLSILWTDPDDHNKLKDGHYFINEINNNDTNGTMYSFHAARNCLVDKDGRVKVGDFGLSRCLYDDEAYFNQITEFPVRWWAVEVLQREPYTTKSDVWSYGITIWEVFSKAEVPYSDISANYLVMDTVKAGKRLEKPGKCPMSIYEIMYQCCTKVRLESGPTVVGDEQTDPELMAYLGAKCFHEKCNNFSEYRTDDCARVVLDKLEKLGYCVRSMTGIGQTCIWLLHKS
ncbi:unnamed protein product [Rotaria magnacalcarata]|uniref:GTP cyclohydrolase 1 feedback regulatory protein n=1 Tax=Rotaria magnacalcarata TaxID=392030 RepID=A0A8S2PD62_9BILA|nr:unnamed protein product [Rotaria magnacalcarata]